MNDRGWLETIAIFVGVLYLWRCLRRRGERQQQPELRAEDPHRAIVGTRFDNVPTPKPAADEAPPPGLAPSGANGTVPPIDGVGGSACECS